MTLALVKKELNRFLSSPDSEVLALRGEWGVGKTYSWNKVLGEAKLSNTIYNKKYAYLSLFGIGSLAELKYSLFEQTVDQDLIGEEPSLKSFQKNTLQLSKSLGKKSWRLFSAIRLMKAAAPAFDALSFFSVRDTLICLDDLERRSESLRDIDVLGLVSLLKEQRNCKVIFLLNDGQAGLEGFKIHREKVIDIELHFNPTAEESAEIAFSGLKPLYVSIGELSKTLEITNIRTLKKIERLVRLVEPKLASLESEVTHQILHSLVLYSWCHYHAGDESIPPLEYVLNVGFALYGIGEKDDVSEQERAWNTTLQDYGYQIADELDNVLASAVKTGYIHEDEFQKAAKLKNDQIIASKATDSFSKAWRLYHDSFENNQDIVVDSLYESFKINVAHITPTNLDGTVRLFRELGENEKADEIISFYLESRRGEAELFDLEEDSFGANITDSKLRDAFQKENEKNTKKELPRDVLFRIAGKNGWGAKDEKVLASTSADEYYEIFKSEAGKHLLSMVNTCLRFGRFSNASDEQKQIAENARKALVRIGAESEINKRRVLAHGVKLSDN